MKPVMLATDGSESAGKATETAIELAKLMDTELVLVTVWNIPYTTVGLAAAPINGELAKVSEGEARKIVAEAAARAEEAGVKTHSLVLRGVPVEEICLAADQYDPHFLVIGSHGRGVAQRVIFGSVSTGVLHHATCPVLVIRGAEGDARTGDRATEKALA